MWELCLLSEYECMFLNRASKNSNNKISSYNNLFLIAVGMRRLRMRNIQDFFVVIVFLNHPLSMLARQTRIIQTTIAINASMLEKLMLLMLLMGQTW